MQTDIASLFNPMFDRNEQLELVASTLEHLRTTYPKKWKSLGKGERVPEFKAVVSSLVRAADQSIDAHTTVAYVTRAVVDELEVMASSRTPRRALKGDLRDANRFSHEHATPVEVLVRTVTLAENKDASIAEILGALSCRVLVTTTECRKIDAAHDWTVPSSLEWAEGIGFGLRTLTPLLIPLIRYHEVDPSLAFSLVPLSPIHADLFARFRKLMDATTPEELRSGLDACRRTPKTSFVLSDDIYRGTVRRRVPSN